MTASEIQKLKFRRQYIIAPKSIECPFLNFSINLQSNYILYAHKDLVVTEYIEDKTRIILIGDIFDYGLPVKKNIDILKELSDNDFKNLVAKLARYTGRYVIIFQQDSDIKLIHDNMASRKIFYANIDGSSWIASQPNLLAGILDLKETTEASKWSFYNSHEFNRLNNSNVGDTTVFDEVFQVLPNHYYDVSQNVVVRYWPEKAIEPLNMADAAKHCAQMLKGYMESICSRYDVMLPVTAGKDSRLLLSATKDISEKVFYYVNKGAKLSITDNDISIPKSLLRKLGLKFNILNPYIPMDEDFKSVYYANNKRASEKYLPLIFNYYSNFGNRVNLPGNIASQAFYRLKYPDSRITPELLAELNHVGKYDFAVRYYEKWLINIADLCKKSNIHILNLFYWEERIANWGTQIQMDKDIAQEEFNPYNSRLLTILFLSIELKYLLPPNYKFHKEIVKNLWPEALKEPINPSFKSNLKKVLRTVGLLKVYYRIKRSFSMVS